MNSNHVQVIENGESSRFRSCLTRLKEQEELVLVYADEEASDECSAGYIATCTDDEIILLYVDRYGYNNGIEVIMTDDIIKIEYGDKYAERLKKLHAARKEPDNFYYVENKNAFISVLSYAQVNKKIVTIEIVNSDNEDATGYVEKIDNNMLTIELVDFYGVKGGRAIIDIEDITHLHCDGDDERALDLLVGN